MVQYIKASHGVFAIASYLSVGLASIYLPIKDTHVSQALPNPNQNPLPNALPPTGRPTGSSGFWGRWFKRLFMAIVITFIAFHIMVFALLSLWRTQPINNSMFMILHRLLIKRVWKNGKLNSVSNIMNWVCRGISLFPKSFGLRSQNIVMMM